MDGLYGLGSSAAENYQWKLSEAFMQERDKPGISNVVRPFGERMDCRKSRNRNGIEFFSES
jgi:hypothetical protein